MKFTRKAAAQWTGTGKDGQGTLTTDSKVLDATQYSYKARFENGIGTNPEELIGAAHAGCFTMQLSFLLDAAGYKDKQLNTEAQVSFENGAITLIQLRLTGTVANIAADTFQSMAEEAKRICPISKLLNTSTTLSVELISA
jgi:osmotically inducible protein OsmC